MKVVIRDEKGKGFSLRLPLWISVVRIIYRSATKDNPGAPSAKAIGEILKSLKNYRKHNKQFTLADIQSKDGSHITIDL